MRRVAATEFLSLDGVMQAPGSADEDRSGGFEHGGWHQPYFDEVQMQSAAEGIAETDAYLFGRRTYEIFASYWPNQPDSDPFAKTLNALPKYVASRTLREPLPWQPATVVRDVASEVAALKAQPGGAISILGSGELVRALLAADLLDAIGLIVDPIVLGSGKRLFEPGLPLTRFRLVDSKASSTGSLVLRYERATD